MAAVLDANVLRQQVESVLKSFTELLSKVPQRGKGLFLQSTTPGMKKYLSHRGNILRHEKFVFAPAAY